MKSRYVMNMKTQVAKSDETCAVGTAMFAAVVAGIYPDVKETQAAMGQGLECEYTPNEVNRQIYDDLYGRYLKLGEFTE